MTSILITYDSGEGQTATVARYVDELLTERDFDVTTRAALEADDLDPADFDGVLVGASVTNGEHEPGLVAFVQGHAETLADRPTGFFQLSLASAFGWTAATQGAQDYVDTLVEATGWEPDRIARFGDALQYSQYSWPMRYAFELADISSALGRDTSLDFGNVERDEVEDFALAFGEFVEIERSASVPDAAVAAPGGGSRLRRAALALGVLGVAGAALWAIRRRVGLGGFDTLQPDIGEISLPADGPRAARTGDAEESGSAPDETVDVDGPDSAHVETVDVEQPE